MSNFAEEGYDTISVETGWGGEDRNPASYLYGKLRILPLHPQGFLPVSSAVLWVALIESRLASLSDETCYACTASSFAKFALLINLFADAAPFVKIPLNAQVSCILLNFFIFSSDKRNFHLPKLLFPSFHNLIIKP